MRDVIRVEGMDFQAFVGIYPHEQKLPQPITVDLALYLCLRDAGLNEDIKSTIDYDDVVQLTENIVAERHYKLVETLAETIASQLKTRFGPRLEKIRVRVAKPRAVLSAQCVLIEIER